MNCVMICDHADHTGGVSSVVTAQAAGLKAAGYKVFVFAAYGPVFPLLAANAEEVHVLSPEITHRDHLGEIWNAHAAQQLAAYLTRFSPLDTIVHVHSLSMGLSPSIAGALIDRGIPYVITAHDAGWACPTGHFYNFRTKEYCTYEPFSLRCLACNCDEKTIVHKAFKLIKVAVLDYVSQIKQGAAAIIAPSDLLRARLMERVPAATPVMTLMNPVNSSDNGPRTVAGSSFLYAGRMREEKGIGELLTAIGDDYPLTVVGDGPRRSEFEQRYSNVDFKGWLPPDAVLAEMPKAIALILPSIYLEAFGLVVAEALAQGVPVIVSDRSGAATLVEHGHNGFVVDMGATGEIASACQLLLNPSIASTMAENAYHRYWQDPLSLDRHIADLRGIYGAVVPSHRGLH